MSQSIQLVYFDGKGRAEAIRLALTIGDIPFEDVRLSIDQFQEANSSGQLPLAQLPVLKIGAETLPQSMAILRYAGRLASLYPEDPFLAARVDTVLDTFQDLVAKVYRETDPEKKEASRKQIAAEDIPLAFRYLESLLQKSGSGFLVGQSLSIADLYAYTIINTLKSGILDHIPQNVLDPFPQVLALHNIVASHPKVQAWEAAHKK
eukprot:c5725_g1_i1.p1 GENE.c5725_g1_i1~~c5725_g1_i1.p1  ORF type:complete len:206 (-),score=44.60 c5725_g1_i1:23-640(-)